MLGIPISIFEEIFVLSAICGLHLFACMLTDAVRRNWHSTERVDTKRVRAAMCECLKHAAQREVRRQAREQKQARSRPDFAEDLVTIV